MRGFADCIDAMNCHMLYGMTTKVSSGTELALFLHQMIPHHQVRPFNDEKVEWPFSRMLIAILLSLYLQNAVNMAKALLSAGFLPCDDLTDE